MRIIFSVVAAMGLFVSSACAANHHEEVKQTTSIETPSLFMSLDKYKEVNEKDYIIKSYDRGWPSYGYYFKSPNDMSCGMGSAGHSIHNPECSGIIPAVGGLGEKKARSITINGAGVPLPSMLADIQPGDSPYATTSDMDYKKVKLLPVGYKFHLDKADPDSSFLGSTCVVPDKDSLGCINTANHGFLVTRDSTIVF